MSPFVTASSTASSPGRKVRKSGSREDTVLGKFESIMEPGDSSMAHEWTRLAHAPQVIAAETSVLRRPIHHEAEVSQAF